MASSAVGEWEILRKEHWYFAKCLCNYVTALAFLFLFAVVTAAVVGRISLAGQTMSEV